MTLSRYLNQMYVFSLNHICLPRIPLENIYLSSMMRGEPWASARSSSAINKKKFKRNGAKWKFFQAYISVKSNQTTVEAGNIVFGGKLRPKNTLYKMSRRCD